MKPAELDKELTIILEGLLADTGFSKKRKGVFRREANECEQFFNFYFTRDKGMPGNIYSLTASMSFAFSEVDKLTSIFMGEEYDSKWGTGTRPLYSIIPDNPVHKYKYCADESLEKFAEMLSDDIHSYALPFYDKYDTLEKLGSYFERLQDGIDLKDRFSVIRAHGNGCWCCEMAVLCLLQQWDKIKLYISGISILTVEQKEKIENYISTRE